MKKFLLFAAAALVAAGAAAETKNVLAEMYPGAQNLIGWGVDGLLETVSVDGRDALKVTNPEAKDFWAVQIAYDTEFVAGTTYYFTFDVKGDAGTITSGFQQTNGYIGCGNFENFSITSEWKTVTIKGTATTSDNGDPNRWVANVGDYVGAFYISNMSLYTLEEGGETPEDPTKPSGVSLINGGVASEGETASIQAGWSGPAKVVANPAGEGVVFETPIAADPTYAWDTQMFIIFNEGLMAGDKYSVSFDYYCSDSRTISIQAQGNPGAYQHWFCGVPELAAKAEWQSVNIEDYEVDADMAGAAGFKTMAFNLASATPAATFYVNNVKVTKATASGVKTVNAVVVPAKGVYNLNGVKVANSLDEVAVPGLYISNGKKIVKK